MGIVVDLDTSSDSISSARLTQDLRHVCDCLTVTFISPDRLSFGSGSLVKYWGGKWQPYEARWTAGTIGWECTLSAIPSGAFSNVTYPALTSAETLAKQGLSPALDGSYVPVVYEVPVANDTLTHILHWHCLNSAEKNIDSPASAHCFYVDGTNTFISCTWKGLCSRVVKYPVRAELMPPVLSHVDAPDRWKFSHSYLTSAWDLRTYFDLAFSDFVDVETLTPCPIGSCYSFPDVDGKWLLFFQVMETSQKMARLPVRQTLARLRG